MLMWEDLNDASRKKRLKGLDRDAVAVYYKEIEFEIWVLERLGKNLQAFDRLDFKKYKTRAPEVKYNQPSAAC